MTLRTARALPLLVALCLSWTAGAKPPAAADRAGAAPPTAEQRGEYIFWAAGGCGCHTDYKRKGMLLAGGRAVGTPFGTFYGTNITPDRDTGIGAWSKADFVRAMREGLAPGGRHLFPVFPYTSFTRMTGAHLSDLWAYLRSVPAVKRPNTPHDVWPPFGWRWSAGLWKRMFFTPQRFRPDPAKAKPWNRGAYLANALGHCAECHTPRNLSGALKAGMHLAGSLDGPEGQASPNITPHNETGIGTWSVPDIVWYLQTGSDPDGDSAEGLMEGMIEHGFGKLSEAGLTAIAVYLKSLPPIEHAVVVKGE